MLTNIVTETVDSRIAPSMPTHLPNPSANESGLTGKFLLPEEMIETFKQNSIKRRTDEKIKSCYIVLGQGLTSVSVSVETQPVLKLNCLSPLCFLVQLGNHIEANGVLEEKL